MCLATAVSALVTGTARPAGAATRAPGGVEVIQLSGLIDRVNVDFLEDSLAGATRRGAEVLVVQLDSTGGARSEGVLDAFIARRASASSIPFAVWVGQSGAHAYGAAYRLAASADVVGVAPNTRVGNGERGGTSADPLDRTTERGDPALDRLAAAGRTVVRNTPTLGDFIVSLDGVSVRGTTLRTADVVTTDKGPRRQPIGNVSLAKLTLTARLLHTAASPATAYFLLVLGLLLIVFEFYVAGVGIAGVVGVAALVLSCYGLAALPTRPLGVALVVLGILGFAVDVQAGAPRFWTAFGTLSLVVGTLTVFADHRVSLLTAVLVIVGVVLFMVAGMPSMVRARFSTPTIGREAIIGESGVAIDTISPEGRVEVRGAQWQARTNRATPIAAGDALKVVAVDGLLLEVEPATGGAKDYRERAKERHASTPEDTGAHDG